MLINNNYLCNPIRLNEKQTHFTFYDLIQHFTQMFLSLGLGLIGALCIGQGNLKNNINVLYSFPRASVTNYQKLGGLK